MDQNISLVVYLIQVQFLLILILIHLHHQIIFVVFMMEEQLQIQVLEFLVEKFHNILEIILINKKKNGKIFQLIQ